MIPKRLLQRLILTTVLMWFLIRILAIAVMWVYLLISGAAEGFATFSPGEMIFITFVVLMAFWADIRVSRERILLANLGLSPVHVSSVVLLCALVLELGAAASIGPILREAMGR
jgi:hypothetical protein